AIESAFHSAQYRRPLAGLFGCGLGCAFGDCSCGGRSPTHRSNVRFGSGGAGGPQIKFDLAIVPDSEFPQFWPPIEPGSVLADLDAHLWILPTTSVNASGGFTYDVVNRNGDVFERVQLPKGHVLVGFGAHNVVYLTKIDGKASYLERALLTGRSAVP